MNPRPRQRPARDMEDAGSFEGTEDPRMDEHAVYGLGIAAADDRQPAYGQGVVISLLVGGAVLLLAILSIGAQGTGDPPVRAHTDLVFWVIAVVTMLIACGGAEFAERTATKAAAEFGHAPKTSSMATAWAVPLVATFAAILLVATLQSRVMFVIGPAIAIFGIAGALLSRDLLDEPDEQSARVAAVIHTLAIHGTAFLAFSAIYLNKLNSWISAPLTAVVAGVLVLEALERSSIGAAQRVSYALLAAGILGAITVPLNWWPTYGWAASTTPLAVFFIVAGLMLTRAQKGMPTVRDLVEFCGSGGVFLLVLALFA